MTGDELRVCVEALDRETSVAVLALHALEDAPDAPGRIIALRALRGALGRLSRDSHALDVELRLIGVR